MKYPVLVITRTFLGVTARPRGKTEHARSRARQSLPASPAMPLIIYQQFVARRQDDQSDHVLALYVYIASCMIHVCKIVTAVYLEIDITFAHTAVRTVS